MSPRYSCIHFSTVSDVPISDIIKSKENTPCNDCNCYGPNLWICLYHDCLKIGCSENFNDHSTLHNQACPSHCIHMNLSTQRIWCYACKSEVFIDGKLRKNTTTAVPRPTTVVYNDSDNETVDSDNRLHITFDRESYDSGRGSYTTLRTDSSDRRNSNILYAFDRSVGLNIGMSGDSGDSTDTDDGEISSKPRGLVGLQNIGNTCYMNSALQALSNTPPLTNYFLDCGAGVRLASEGRKPGLSRAYLRLIREMWHRKTRGYVVPSSILYGIRNVHSMFRGYHQHDTQEFLRCFMDQLHEELKQSCHTNADGEYQVKSTGSCDTLDSYTLAAEAPQPIIEQGYGYSNNYEALEGTSASASQSEGEYETCDSGVSERSSLSDDTERSVSEGRRGSGKRRLSRSCSPGRQTRLRSKLTSSHCRSVSPHVVESQPGSSSNNNQPKKQMNYRSIISDVFDGKLLSSVQCLTCDRISTRIETFQDLSLPIPNRDHLAVLHGTGLTGGKGAPTSTQTSTPLTCTEAVYPGSQDGWVAWLWTWLKSWFYGPVVSLHDCLAAFFSADELKGDNMYSCEKCNKLRNGVKFSKVIDLPEVLCIHLKRFRHELMFSSKISSQVSFPLSGLDMRPYLHKECVSEVSSYDLISVICHHGTAGGGHYTCYSLNAHTDTWFEFDDQYVTQVSPDTVLGCEAYVLFYRKSNVGMQRPRQKTIELTESCPAEASEMKFYISRQWISKFNTFAEPGPIDNSDFLCQHGGVIPERVAYVEQLTMIINQSVWEYLYDTFGGGPACNHLYECPICEQAMEALNKRITLELETFRQLNHDFQLLESCNTVYAISMNWFRLWQQFVRNKNCDPPGPIDNSNIIVQGQQDMLKPGSDYATISEELWQFFHNTYGGGPEVRQRTSKVGSPPQRSQSVTAITSTHFENLTITSADSVPEFFIPSLKPKKKYYEVNIEIDEDIAPVHDTKVSEPIERLDIVETSAPDMTMEVANTNTSINETLTEENEVSNNEISQMNNESNDEISTKNTQQNDIKQRRRKRGLKCKKNNNKDNYNNEGKSQNVSEDK